MNFLDVTKMFDGEASEIALLSTFLFDPNYFEKRLLRCPALSKARRIAVFMDARQWLDLLRQDVPTTALNRRYLVVPVHRTTGVFHPKLSLLLTSGGGRVLCGSNNITRSGCSSNLELLNAVMEDTNSEFIPIARSAFKFFRRAAVDTDEEIGRIAREWLAETEASLPWLSDSQEPDGDQRISLLHTYDGSLWDRIVDRLGDAQPTNLLIISPFHDADGKMLRRIRQQWPRCEIELVVQQDYTTLPVHVVKTLRSGVELSEIQIHNRRLHAKLLAWKSASRSGCLVGSANLTGAAFDGRNVETCLLFDDDANLVASLFDDQLSTRRISLNDFEPGKEELPEDDLPEIPSLRISSAILLESGQLRVSYAHDLNEEPTALRIAIRGPGEPRERTSVKVPNRRQASETVALPEVALADTHSTLLASLVVESPSGRRESMPVWIVQEGRLTYQASEGSSSTQRKIEDSGEGLIPYLDELARREGALAAIEYLHRLNIRFHDGGGGLRFGRRFRLVIRDPFHTDTAPEWLLQSTSHWDDLEAAIYGFVDRHEKSCLRKHAVRGNINGMGNFLDIFTTILRLLYTNYRRGIVKRGRLIGYMTDLIEIATDGNRDQAKPSDGYLSSVYDNLAGDSDLIQEACDETNFLGEMYATLLIVQKIRYVPNEQSLYGPSPTRPKEVLGKWSDLLRTTVAELGLASPTSESVMNALRQHALFSDSEISDMLAEL